MKGWNKLALGAGILIVGVPVVVGLITVSVNFFSKDKRDELGVLAVKSLYEFGSVIELDSKMDVLRELTTDEVYQNLTIDKTDRALRVYLKFNNNPSTVVVEKATSSYVLYHLETESIRPTRKFIFTFSVNKDGKIDYVQEGEFVDFTLPVE